MKISDFDANFCWIFKQSKLATNLLDIETVKTANRFSLMFLAEALLFLNLPNITVHDSCKVSIRLWHVRKLHKYEKQLLDIST